MSNAWAGGSTRAWRKTRAAVLQRDGYRCLAHTDGWCAKANRSTDHTCTELAEESGPNSGTAHHIRGKRHGDDPAWLVAACRACNLYIGDPDQVADPQPQPVTRWS